MARAQVIDAEQMPMATGARSVCVHGVWSVTLMYRVEGDETRQWEVKSSGTMQPKGQQMLPSFVYLRLGARQLTKKNKNPLPARPTPGHASI